MNTLKFSPQTNIGIIDNYEPCERTLHALFFTHYAAKRRGSPKCFFGTTGVNNYDDLSFKWRKRLFHLNNKKDYEIAGWSLKFDLCVWYIYDEHILNIIKENNPKCKHAYVVDYYKFSESQQNFCKQMDYIICPSIAISEMYIGIVPENNILVMPPDVTFMDLLPANRFRLSRAKNNAKIVISYLTNVVTLKSSEVFMLLSMLDVIPELKLLFLTYDGNIRESKEYKTIKERYGDRIAFRVNPSDFELIRLSEREIYYYIDFQHAPSHGTMAAVFKNAGIPVICYDVPITKDAYVNGATGLFLPGKSVKSGFTEMVGYDTTQNDSILKYLYDVINNTDTHVTLLNNMDVDDARSRVKMNNRLVSYTLLPTQGDLTKNKKEVDRVFNEFSKCFSVFQLNNLIGE